MKENTQNQPTVADGSYTVKKSRVFNLIAVILAALLSILLWMYAMSLQTEKTVKVDVVVKNGGVFGYTDGETVDTVSLTLTGRNLDFREFDLDEIVAYVDLKEAKPGEGTQTFPIAFRVPGSVTYKNNGSASLTLAQR